MNEHNPVATAAMFFAGAMLVLIVAVFVSHGVGIPPLSFVTSLGGILFTILVFILLASLVLALIKHR